jgi:transcriptional regulator with XRE-family HTH domain
MITGAQIRLARAHLGWERSKLAAKSGLGLSTINRAEATDGEAPVTIVHENAIRRVLMAAGIEFTAEDDGTPGVRLRKDPPNV